MKRGINLAFSWLMLLQANEVSQSHDCGGVIGCCGDYPIIAKCLLNNTSPYPCCSQLLFAAELWYCIIRKIKHSGASCCWKLFISHPLWACGWNTACKWWCNNMSSFPEISSLPSSPSLHPGHIVKREKKSLESCSAVSTALGHIYVCVFVGVWAAHL